MRPRNRPLAIPERRPDSVAPPAPPGQRAVLVLGLRGPDRPRSSSVPAAGADGYVLNQLQPHGDCHTSARSGGTSCWSAAAPGSLIPCSATASRSTTPIGPPGSFQEFQQTPRLRSAPHCSPIARELGSGDPRRRGAARLRPHPDRAVRRTLPRAGTRVGEEEPRAVPDSELRLATGTVGELPGRRRLRRTKASSGARCRRRGGPRPPRISFGKPVTSSETWTWLHSPAFRATPFDLKAEAESALPLRHQPADRPRLAVLRRRRPLRPAGCSTPPASTRTEPVVAGDGRHRTLPAARRATAPPGQSPAADVALYAPTDDAWAMIRPVPSAGTELCVPASATSSARGRSPRFYAGHTFDLD